MNPYLWSLRVSLLFLIRAYSVKRLRLLCADNVVCGACPVRRREEQASVAAYANLFHTSANTKLSIDVERFEVYLKNLDGRAGRLSAALRRSRSL